MIYHFQDTEYTATIKVPSQEFQRICRDLSQFGDTVVISAKKGAVEFSGAGDIGSAKIVLKENGSIDDDKVEKACRLTIFNFLSWGAKR